MNPSDSMEVDHINHDRLDNRKKNLRVVTRSQNKMNRRFKGYHLHKNGRQPIRYRVVRRKDKKTVYEKHFKTEEEAKEAAKQADIKYFGEYRYKLKN